MYGTGTETYQGNKDNSGINSCTNKYLIFTRALNIDIQEKIALSTNDAGATE